MLVKNKDWWGHKAGYFESNLEEVQMLTVSSAATRLAALLSGEVDLVIDPPNQDVSRLRANPQAWEYFSGKAPSYQKAAVWWVVSAKKDETREKRLATLIEHSAQGEMIPQFIPRKSART